jgi:NTE family protein
MQEFELGLCLSGGGYRAMLFHAGALTRLNEAGVLGRIDLISSVSGGSIAAGVLAASWKCLTFDGDVATNFRAEFLDPVMAFSKQFLDAPSIVSGTANPFSSAAATVANAYDRHLFQGKTLQDLPDRPRFVFCASNLSTGSLFRFSKKYVADYRIGLSYSPEIPLATAVAASAAFPPFLSPLRLDLSGLVFKNEDLDEAVGTLAAVPSRAVLTDGGVYDNHGLEPAIKRCKTILVSDAGAPWKASASAYRNWFSQLKRVMHTTDNQVRALRRRDIIGRFLAGAAADEAGLPPDSPVRERGAVRGTYWSIVTDPSRYPAPKPIAFDPQRAKELAQIGTWLHFLGERESEDLVNWGYYVSDVALRSHYNPKPAPPIALPVAAGTMQAGLWPRTVKRVFDWFG